MKARRGTASQVTRCRGRCVFKGRPCRFLLANGREWCRWHAGQAAESIGPPLAQLPAADPGVASRMPDRNTRALVIGGVAQGLVIGSGLVAAVSMDALHRNIVAARVQRGQARPSFGPGAMGIKFPQVEGMSWADVNHAPRD